MHSDEKKSYGEYVRAVMERLGLDRDQFAARIGVSVQTLRNVIQGHQNLGKAAKRNVEVLSRGESFTEVHESPTQYASAALEQYVRTFAELASEPGFREQVNAVKDALGVDERRATEIVVRVKLEDREKN